MAQQVVTTVTDDFDDTEGASTVAFALEGQAYEIDLSTEHADTLREVLADYIAAGRKVTGSRRAAGKGRRGRPNREESAAIRAWARGKGYKVSDRGRIPASIVTEYATSHAA